MSNRTVVAHYETSEGLTETAMNLEGHPVSVTGIKTQEIRSVDCKYVL
jgi:hypothetical protein